MALGIRIVVLVGILVGVVGETKNLQHARYVAVVHDSWYRPDDPTYDTLMMKVVLDELKEVLPPLVFSTVPLSSIMLADVNSFVVGSPTAWVGVVAMGGCQVQNAVSRAESLLKVPVMYVSWRVCANVRHRSENTVWLNDIQFHMRYNCLIWVLRQWASAFLLAATTSFNTHYNFNVSLGTKEAFIAEDIMYRCAGKVEVGNLYRARQALKGRLLRVVTKHRPPFVFLEVDASGKILRHSGYAFDMLEQLRKKFDFRYEVMLPYDENWGSKLPNGTWNGMVGMVQRKDADLAVGPFTITLERAKVIAFTFPYYNEPTAILTPVAGSSKKILAFLSPFRYEVWLGVLVSLLILGPVMMLTSRTPSGGFLYPYNDPHPERRLSLWRCYWALCASLFQQGVSLPMSLPSRFAFGGWVVAVVALTCAYTGVLISFLTVPKSEIAIDGLSDLPSQNLLQWTFIKNSAHHSLFVSDATDGIYKDIGSPFVHDDSGLVDTNEEGIQKVLRGTHVFIKERSFLDFIVEKDFRDTGECNLDIAREEFFPATFGWILQKGDDIRKLFNNEFLLMQQGGLFAKWKKQYWPSPNICTSSGYRSEMQALDIQDMKGSFIIVAAGFAVGVLLLVTECCCKKKKSRLEQREGPWTDKHKEQVLSLEELSEKDLKTLAQDETSVPSDVLEKKEEHVVATEVKVE